MIRAACALALAAAACLPTLTPLTAPPLGRVATLPPVDGFWGTQRYTLELSAGAAIAVGCEHTGPCEQLVATSADPAIAAVHPATLSQLAPAGPTSLAGYAAARAPAAVVVVGVRPGTTRIQLATRRGQRAIDVTVRPPPAPVASAAHSPPAPPPP